MVSGGVWRLESWLHVERGVGGDSRSSLLGVLLGGRHLFVSMWSSCEAAGVGGKDTGGALDTKEVSLDTTTFLWIVLVAVIVAGGSF